MRLDSARAMKAELRRRVDGLLGDRPVPSDLGDAVAVGICVLGPGTFGLAVRTTEESELSRAVAAHGRALAGDECDVRDVGVVRALQWEPDELQARVRPLRPGLSVAHVGVTAGTIGAFVTPAGGTGDVVHALSNNHVLADTDRGVPGDVVVQPGPTDGGSEAADRIGTLDQAVALRRDGPNLVDAATARVDAEVALETAHPAGVLTGWSDVDDDLAVEKVGRSTGVTRGRVSAIELDGLRVEYPGGLLTFDDQIEVTGDGPGPFSAGGDSGSVVYRPEVLEAVGLLFAGSERGGPGGVGLTYCNPFGVVLDQLGVRLLDAVTSPDGSDRDAARAAKESLREHVGDDPRVNGLAIARWHGRYAVRVSVVDETDMPDLPAEVDGVAVRIVVVGRIMPLDDQP